MTKDERRSSEGRRSGKDRRSGVDGRSDEERRLIGERRSNNERRSGLERRSNNRADISPTIGGQSAEPRRGPTHGGKPRQVADLDAECASQGRAILSPTRRFLTGKRHGSVP